MFFGNSFTFSMMLAIWYLVPVSFLNPACTSGSSQFTYCWSLAWRILSINLLACEICVIVGWFEHSLSCVESTPLNRTELAQTQPQHFCFRSLGPDLTPNMMILATEQRRRPSSHLALVPASSSPTPPPTKAIAVSIPWEMCDSHSHQIQLSHQSRLCRMLLHSDTPSRPH